MRLGVRIGPASPSWRLKALRAQLAVVHLRPDTDRAPLHELTSQGFSVLGVLDRASFSGPRDWRQSFTVDLNRVRDLIRDGLITELAIGHEPDDGWQPGAPDDPLAHPRGGTGSWVMSIDELGELLIRVQEARIRVPLYLGGISRPAYLEQLDLSGLSGILVHPYGFRPEPDWPEPTWGRGELGELLDQVQGVIEAQGLGGQVVVGLGEIGISDYEVDRGFAAEWLTRMLSVAAGRGDVEVGVVCCDADQTLDGYGQFDVNERAKLAVAAIRAVSDRLAEMTREDTGGTREDTRGHQEEDDVEGGLYAWPDDRFPTDEVVAVLDRLSTAEGMAVPEEADVAITWEEVGPFLASYGLDGSVPARVALLAVLAVESAYLLVPEIEVGDYDHQERLYGHRTAYGQTIGHRYPGDGYRYRGRGLVQIRGRSAYQRIGALMGAPLLTEPDEMADPTIAAGAAVAMLAELGLFAAAERGDWVAVGRGLDPGLNRWEPFMRAVQAFSELAEAPDRRHGGVRTDGLFRAAASRVGDPYRPNGAAPGGFDAAGLVTWASRQPGAIELPEHPDAIAAVTDPIDVAEAHPGDLILYSYADPGWPDVRFPHVGLATNRPDVVLDARDSVGVGYHAHILGAVRHYRRVRGPADALDAEEQMWKERYEALAERSRALQEAYAPPPLELPPQKAPKAAWVKAARALWDWAEHQDALTTTWAELLAPEQEEE